MTINVPLEPQQEAKLKALALERGISPGELVRQAINNVLAAVPEQQLKPKKSAYGLLAKYAPGPSEEEIDEDRREMYRSFAEDRL